MWLCMKIHNDNTNTVAFLRHNLLSEHIRALAEAVVHACALQRHSTRASGELTAEKYNCVVWSGQAEVAVSVF